MKRYLVAILAAVLAWSLAPVAVATEYEGDDETPPAWLGIGEDFPGNTSGGEDTQPPPLTYPTQDIPVDEEPTEEPPQEQVTDDPGTSESTEPETPPATVNPSDTGRNDTSTEEPPEPVLPDEEVDPDHEQNEGLSTFDPTEWITLPEVTPGEDSTQPEATAPDTNIYFNREGGLFGEVYKTPQVPRRNSDVPKTADVGTQLVDEAEALRQYNREVIQGIRSGVVSTTAPQKQYSVRDVLGIIAVVFVAVAIVVLWIMTYIRARRDPTRKWLK